MSPRKPRGVFVNTRKATCSIHESGRMIYEALRGSLRYDIDYMEIDADSTGLPSHYDFYAFNYHHVGMSWLDTRSIRSLPGLKLTFILEVAPGDPFVLCPPRDFDAFLPLDPTLRLADARVFPFPRPLEAPPVLPPFAAPPTPVIGSFGFATPGKGFELVVDAVNREFDRALIRLNIPGGVFADRGTFVLHRRPYVDVLEERCRRVAKPGVEVVVTRDYLDKDDLIRWCAGNTLNCFLYNRDQPGLSATTDQAIASGRPLAVSTNPTFRHIHAYLEPYPLRSLQESLAVSTPEVLAMQRDWAPGRFALRMEEVLAAHGLLEAPAESVCLRAVPEPAPDRPAILLVNHPQQQCGIHQYGRNLAEALAKSGRYRFRYRECSSEAELRLALAEDPPAAVVFNYYILTMPWLTPAITRSLGVPAFGVFHEVTQADADRADRALFDFHLAPDPTLETRNPWVLKIPRLIPTYVNLFPEPDVPTIGSFGFAFSDKGLAAIVDAVQREFDEAVIKLHLPSNDLVSSDVAHILRDCAARVHKPGIQLKVNRKFLDRKRLLDFLAQNSLNLFLYDVHKDKGISSVIEHALAVQRPVAVNRCGMFRHVHRARPSICIEDRSLREILADGTAPQTPFLQEWNESAFILGVEQALASVIEPAGTAAAPPPRPAPPETGAPVGTGDCMATLKQRSDVGRARETLRARGLSFTEPSEAIPGLGIIGDPLKSWDVLRTVEAIRARIPLTGSVLDLGAFSCEILPILHRMGYRHLTGIDLNPDISRMPFASEIQYLQGDFHATGLPDASFDAITALSVIEHGFDAPRLLREVGRLLKPGGLFIASVDYWPEKIPTEGKEIFGLSWRIFSEAELRQFFRDGAAHGLQAEGPMDFGGDERVVHYEDRDYTFGWFCLAKSAATETQPVLWLAPEDPSSAIASLPALARAAAGLQDRPFIIVCPEETRDLHAACPGVGRILAYDLSQARSNPGYLKALAQRVGTFPASLLLSPGGQEQPVVASLAAASGAEDRIGFGTGPAFTRGLPLESPLVPEAERITRFLEALGLPSSDLAAGCFTTAADEDEARDLARRRGLDLQRTVFLLAGPTEDLRTPFQLGAALRETLAGQGLQAVVLGPPEAAEVAAHWIEDLGPGHLDLCGQLAPRARAAMLRFGRAAVGGEGPAMMLAAAVGLPHVVLAGGGAFGRFSPASRKAHLVSLPLACYGCGWHCPYPEAYCVQRVPGAALQEALLAALAPSGPTPRLYVPAVQTPIDGGPEALDLEPLLNPAEVELHRTPIPDQDPRPQFGIAIFHALGDVLNLTPVARQLKADHPGCRVTWFTSEACAPALAGNPHVDELVALPGDPASLDGELPRLRASRPWTRFFAPAPYLNYDKAPGGSLWDLYRAAPGLRWTEGSEPVLALDPGEIHRAEAWWDALPSGPRILVEWDFTSDQSRFDEAAAFEMASRLADLDPVFVFSSRRAPGYLDRFKARHRAVWCQESYRLNAVFYNRCDAFIGVSSGITALSGSSFCRKDVPSIEFVRGEHWSSAGLGKHSERLYAFTPRRFTEALDRLRIRLLELRWMPDTTPRHQPLETLPDGRERVPCPGCGETSAKPVREGDVVECAACALVYPRLRRIAAGQPPFHRLPASRAEASAHPDFRASRRTDLVDRTLACLDVDPSGCLLVGAGCRWGAVLLEARDRGLQTLGFERDAACAAFATRELALDVRGESFLDSALPEGSAGIVVFDRDPGLGTDPMAALDRAAYVLREGGLLAIAVPNFQGLGSEALRERWPGFGPDPAVLFTPASLRALVLQAGFEILACTTPSGALGEALPLQLIRQLEPGIPEARAREHLRTLEEAGRGEEIHLIARRRGSYKGRAIPSEIRVEPSSIRQLLWVRTDALGDALLASSMLEPLGRRFPGARITAVCQDKTAPLYEACPFVAEVISYDRLRALQDPAYRQETATRIAAVRADLALHSVFSREPLGDAWVAASGARLRVAFQGDAHNMTPEQHRLLDGVYNVRVPGAPGMDLELDRHRIFLRALGIETDPLRPTAWTTPEDEASAEEIFRREGLDPSRTLALFAGAQFDMRVWRGYAEALAPLVQAGGYRVLALGSEGESSLNQAHLDRLGAGHLNLCGRLGIRQAAAVLRRCKAAVGAETGLAHLSRAVGTPCAVLLGGGHFGRFMPYDAGTAVACLPLDCFLCDWSCPFPLHHCVKDLAPEVLRAAVESVLGPPADRIRIFAQADWSGGEGRPRGIDLAGVLDPALTELIPVSSRPWGDPAAATRRLPDLPSEARSTVICAVWHRDPCRMDLLKEHQACLDAQTVPVGRVYVFDGGDTPPAWLKGQVVVSREPLTIYEAWNLALTVVRSPYVLNLNLDDRLAPDTVARYEQALDEGADLVGGDWRICFDPSDTDPSAPCAPLGTLPFHSEWPPVPGRPTRLGSGDGSRGTYGPACAWRMSLHGELGRYPWRFGDGTPIRTISDALWWNRLLQAGKRLVRLPWIVGSYRSSPGNQAEFRSPAEAEQARYARTGLSSV